MNTSNSVNIQNQLLSIIDKIFSRIQLIDEKVSKLSEKKEFDTLIMHGINGLKKEHEDAIKVENKFNPQIYALKLIHNDTTLRFPHRKILEYLSNQYDFEKKVFKEVNFSILVKQCRIGKNKTGEYFRLLEEKGYIKKRDDGYRVWYKFIFN